MHACTCHVDINVDGKNNVLKEIVTVMLTNAVAYCSDPKKGFKSAWKVRMVFD
jgi:hypothetical protein